MKLEYLKGIKEEKAIDSVILESYKNGVSTSNVRNVIAALGLENGAASYVSSLSSKLDVKVNQFLEKNSGTCKIHIHRCHIL